MADNVCEGIAGEGLLREAEKYGREASEDALVDLLNRLISFSRQIDGRRSLGFLGAVPRVVRILQDLLAASEHFADNLSQSSENSAVHNSAEGGISRSSLPSLAALKCIMLLLRVLRNLCAGVAANQDAFLACNAHLVIANKVALPLVRVLLQNAACHSESELGPAAPMGQVRVPENSHSQEKGAVPGGLTDFAVGVKDVLRAALQALGNFVGGGELHKDAVWQHLVPAGVLTSVATALHDREVQDPLCMILYSCCFRNAERRHQLCHMEEGRKLMKSLLQAFLLDVSGYSTTESENGGAGGSKQPAESVAVSVSASSDFPSDKQSMTLRHQTIKSSSSCHGGGEWLELLIQSLCLDDTLLKILFHGLVHTADKMNDSYLPSESVKSSINFMPEQVGLLVIVCEMVIDRSESWSAKQKTAGHEPEGHQASQIVIPEESIAFILRLVGETCAQLGENKRAQTSSSRVGEQSPIEPPKNLLTGVVEVDLLGLGLRILRALSAMDIRCSDGQETRSDSLDSSDLSTSSRGFSQSTSISNGMKAGVDHHDVVDVMSNHGVIPLLLDMLQTLWPPSGIRATRKSANDSGDGADTEPHDDSGDQAGAAANGSTSSLQQQLGLDSGSRYPRKDPFRGYRRDLVSIIGNSCFQRKRNQDLIREKGALLTMLQQCVTDEDNPFLREWGFWAMRNLIEGNEENRRELEALEVRGPVQTLELSSLGLKVEINEQTGRPKLVNRGSAGEKKDTE